MHPRFVEALNNLPFVEYQLDMLLSDSDLDKRQIATDYLQKKKEQKGVSELDPVVKVPVYGSVSCTSIPISPTRDLRTLFGSEAQFAAI